MANETGLIGVNVFVEYLERMARTAHPDMRPGLMHASEYAKDFIVANAAPVVPGLWLDVEYDSMWDRTQATCSNCAVRGEVRTKGSVLDSPYCPHCGAQMRGGGKCST